MMYRIGDRIKFVDGVYECKTGTIQALPENGSSKYTIMLDDGKTVKFSKEFFEILNANNDGNENQIDEWRAMIEKKDENKEIDKRIYDGEMERMKIEERAFNLLCEDCKKTIISIEDAYNIHRYSAIHKAFENRELCHRCYIKLIRHRIFRIGNDIKEDELNENFGHFIEYIEELEKSWMPIIINAKTNKKEMENFFKLIEYLRDEAIIGIKTIKHGDGEMEMELPVINSIFVDPGHVAMMNISLLPDEINENSVNTEFAIDINKVKKFLKHYESNDEITIDRIEDDKVFIKHENISFAIALLDKDEIGYEKEPSMEFKGSAILPVKKLRKTIRSINEISDYCKIEIKHDKVIVYGENDVDHIKAIFKKDECDEINIMDDKEEIKSMYDIGDYLKGFIDLLYSLKVDKIKIEMAKDHPMKIHFKTGDIQGYFLLAPRIEY